MDELSPSSRATQKKEFERARGGSPPRPERYAALIKKAQELLNKPGGRTCTPGTLYSDKGLNELVKRLFNE